MTTLRLLALAVFALLLAGCNTVNKPNQNPYDGLLPAGQRPAPSARPWPGPTELKQRSVSIVATSSYDAHVRQYVDYYEGGGRERHKAFMVGVNAMVNAAVPAATATTRMLGADDPTAVYESMRKAQDPRAVADVVTALLKHHFSSVSAAGDFAEAQDGGADYIALIDYWWTPNVMGTSFTGFVSVELLDPDLRSVFTVQAQTSAARPGVSAAGTFQTIHRGLARDISQALRTRLGGARP